MYFPKSQIETNLYTNGNEYYISDPSDSYIGFYWKTSTGKFYTGKTPNATNYKEIFPIPNDNSFNNWPEYKPNQSPVNFVQYTDNFDGFINGSPHNAEDVNFYNFKTNTNVLNTQQLPTYSPTLPTEEDYKIGEFERYFCVKRNQNIYLEIKEDIYNKLSSQNAQVAWQLYKPFKLSWTLTGMRDKVFLTNKNIVALTSQRNQLVGFNLYLKEDYLKYYNG